MTELTPRDPRQRPLLWPDHILTLQDDLLTRDLPPLYIVGGAVRDALLHRPVKDLDLATPSDAIAIARLIANHYDGDIFVMDTERNVARVFVTIDGQPITIDVARFRVETGLYDDLIARDFTVNAIAVDLLDNIQQIIDPLDGEADLLQKVLRRCSAQSIVSDPIRVLRAVRQSVQFSLKIAPDTLQDIRQQVHNLTDTSPERVRDEWFNLLALERVSMALRVGARIGLIQEVIPQLTPIIQSDQWDQTLLRVEVMGQILASISYERTDETAARFDMGMLVMQFDRYRHQLNDRMAVLHASQRPHSSLMILGALLIDIPDTASITTIANNLRLSNDEKKLLKSMVSSAMTIQNNHVWEPIDQHRWWRDHSEQGIDAILLGLADYRVKLTDYNLQNAWLAVIDRTRSLLSAYFDLYDNIVEPPTLITGHDLMQHFNLTGGPIIGQTLTQIKEAQVLGVVTSPESALDFAREFIAAQG